MCGKIRLGWKTDHKICVPQWLLGYSKCMSFIQQIISTTIINQCKNVTVFCFLPQTWLNQSNPILPAEVGPLSRWWLWPHNSSWLSQHGYVSPTSTAANYIKLLPQLCVPHNVSIRRGRRRDVQQLPSWAFAEKSKRKAWHISFFWRGESCMGCFLCVFYFVWCFLSWKGPREAKILMAGVSVYTEPIDLTESEFLLVQSSVFLPAAGPVQLSTFSWVITTALTSLGRPFNTMKPLLVCIYNKLKNAQ